MYLALGIAEVRPLLIVFLRRVGSNPAQLGDVEDLDRLHAAAERPADQLLQRELVAVERGLRQRAVGRAIGEGTRARGDDRAIGAFHFERPGGGIGHVAFYVVALPAPDVLRIDRAPDLGP